MSTRALRLFTTTLLTGAVAVLVTACATSGPASAPTSSGEPVDVSTAIVGAWGADAPGEPHLEFTAEGAVQGSDGCNGISTTYEVDGESVTLEQFASTLKACQGVDDWLRGVRTVEIDGDTLVVMNAEGDKIGELDRR